MPNKTLEKWEECKICDCCEVYQPQTISTKEMVENGAYPVFGANGQIGKYDNYNHEDVEVLVTCRGATCGSINMSLPKSWINGNAMVISPKKNDIDKIYLFYFLKNVDFSNYISGAAQPQITRVGLSPLVIKYPDLSEQQRLVKILDEAFENIEKAKQNALQNLNNAKELFESYLIDTFLNNNETWLADTLQNICEKISAGGDRPEIFSETKTIECNIPIYSNGIKDNGLYGYTNKPTIEKPAITISARGTIGFICKRLEPYCPIVRLISLIPRDFIDLSFLAYAMNFVIPKNTGTSIPQLTVPNLKNNIVKYPPLEEQQKIVQQLDKLQEQTKKLEQIYTQKLQDLNELKQSILQKAFNGEL